MPPVDLATIFADVPDPRTGNAKRHDLVEVLTIALVGAICGADSCVDFADFAEEKEDLFREFLSLDHGLPSHDTFSRIFRLLEPERFAASFAAFLEQLGEEGAGVIAIDGKTLRRSFDRAAGRSPLAVVTAFATDQRLVLSQSGYRSGDGDSEILAARAVLESFDVSGALITGDALHCQRQTCQTIVDRGGDYLFVLAGNNPGLHRDAEEYFADPAVVGPVQHETVEKSHGRLETRRYWINHDIDWLRADRRHAGEVKPLPGQVCLAMVETEIQRGGRVTAERRYYVSSAALTVERFAAASRAHWRIETTQHWVLDMAFDEDRARNRCDHGPENLAILRRLALGVLQRSRRDISVRRKRKRSGWSNAFARTILGQMR